MTTTSFKDAARRLVEQLPDDATWGDLEYAATVRRKIEEGIRASEEGRTTPQAEVMKEFGLGQP